MGLHGGFSSPLSYLTPFPDILPDILSDIPRQTMAWIGLVAAIVAANLLVLSPGDLGMLLAQDIRDLL